MKTSELTKNKCKYERTFTQKNGATRVLEVLGEDADFLCRALSAEVRTRRRAGQSSDNHVAVRRSVKQVVNFLQFYSRDAVSIALVLGRFEC
jgi:hypothetical protein